MSTYYERDDSVPDGEFRKSFVNLNTRQLCSRTTLRNILRDLFDKRDKRYLMVHVKNDKENMMYEGVKVDSWSSGEFGDIAGFKMGDRIIHLNTCDLEAVQVLY